MDEPRDHADGPGGLPVRVGHADEESRRAPNPGGPSLRDVATHERRVASAGDRKSTRLNSSHSQNSEAVFCLKKKNKRAHLSSDPHSLVRDSAPLASDTCFEILAYLPHTMVVSPDERCRIPHSRPLHAPSAAS